MPSAPDRIREAVTHIQDWLTHTPNPGEAIVRQAIVLRLLHAAGFDIWNPAEVVPEETNATGNRADFLIRTGHGAFALELKGMNVTLGAAHYQQAATYAVNEGTRWAIVTNGRVWAVLDEHLPGRWEDRVALKLELGQEGQTFAGDLAALLDVDAWRSGRFPDALHGIRQRQQQRLDEARIRREKTPVVEQVRQQFGIATFELAAQAAAEMNRITEAERDVLLGRSISVPTPDDQTPNAQTQDAQTPDAQCVLFSYRTKTALAHAEYRPAAGTWTVLAGSTALNRIQGDGSNAQALRRRREQQLSDGVLRELDGTLLRFEQDVVFDSPSMAAVAVSGASKNGWVCWKDAAGQLADAYRAAPVP
ncbi:hypothetical protein GCM10008959_27130 [Deinococcus seoulensis]|uniref:DUF4357 domain-containing protein n=1 Tax=Deinococcus seoulensis TaxID=1837379 RepID=A0ABQ2RWP8_9DEIO|nr:DUF4357 domain-containing protein [Deinococcus seoulensis]GGR63556.1 hypothetical protein GCM10008959_27130 [Deinococcus seoulensis]